MSAQADSKLTRKQRRRKTMNQKPSLRRAFFALLRMPIMFLVKLYRIVLSHPRTTLMVVTPLAIVGLMFTARSFLQQYHEQILPSAIVVNASDSRLISKIQTVADSAIRDARRLGWSRAQFMQGLSRSLEEIDGIDEFWLRLGFDKRLQVTATQEIPVLLLETGGGDRYLIGHKLKVIAKNPANIGQKQILRVTVPELKMRSSRQTVKWTKQAKFTRNFETTRFSAENVSLPWLFRQAQVLQAAISKTDLPLSIEKVTWRTHAGFSLSLGGAKEVQVLLGENDLTKKIQKLSDVISDLQSKNLSAETIDLNYADKAIIKMSEQATNKKL